MGIFRNFYTKWGEILTSSMGIPGGLAFAEQILQDFLLRHWPTPLFWWCSRWTT